MLALVLSGCSPVIQLPDQARIALQVRFENTPAVYSAKADVDGFAEFWCVILGTPDRYEFASVQILDDMDGGWNATLYSDHINWEDRCGPIPNQYVSQ